MSTVFRVILEGEQEVPPRHTTASGVGTVIFDSAAVAASYSFDVQGLDFGLAVGLPPQTPTTDDDATRTHFHGLRVRARTRPLSSDRSTQIRLLIKTTTISLLHLIPMAPGR